MLNTAETEEEIFIEGVYRGVTSYKKLGEVSEVGSERSEPVHLGVGGELGPEVSPSRKKN